MAGGSSRLGVPDLDLVGGQPPGPVQPVDGADLLGAVEDLRPSCTTQARAGFGPSWTRPTISACWY